MSTNNDEPDNGYGRPIQPESAWERFEKPLLTNYYNLYSPTVVETPDRAYRYQMWFMGWAADASNSAFPGSDAIFHARSHDLVNWEVYSGEAGWDSEMRPELWHAVVTAGDKYYDAWHNGDPSVVYKDGKFYMVLTATGPPLTDDTLAAHPDGMIACVLGAISDDGIHWTKTPQPILIESLEAQQATVFEGWTGNLCRPSLLWDEGKWRLWFDYWHPTKGVCLGYAESEGIFEAPDSFRLVSDLAEPVIPNWPNPEIIRIGDRYVSFSDPTGYGPNMGKPNEGWISRQICQAESDDGLDWRIVGFIAPDADAVALHVAQALTTRVDGKPYLYLFYATQRGGLINGNHYDYRYDRMRAMRQALPE